MIKPSSILLIFISSVFFSCKNDSIYLNTPEAKRFEDMLHSSNNVLSDTVLYIYWNDYSCKACRIYSQHLVDSLNPSPQNTRFIIPRISQKDAELAPENLKIIDDDGTFTQKYIGIDNIGIIKTYNGKVIYIKNYNAENMQNFEEDLRGEMSK